MCEHRIETLNFQFHSMYHLTVIINITIYSLFIIYNIYLIIKNKPTPNLFIYVAIIIY